MDISLNDLWQVAQEAAYLAGRRTLAYFNTGTAVQTKEDQTPVTCADREAEALIRKTIGRYYPDHWIIGEEEGDTPGDPNVRWIIDPIDGTKTFIHGVPLYGVLIGVEVQNKPQIGVIYLPALDEMVTAATGLGCRWNGRTARVSQVDQLSEAALMSSSITSAQARGGAFDELAGQAKLVRTWGDSYGYALVATGRAEVMVDAAMKVWDCAPMPPILSEAGGHFTNWQGEPTIWGHDAMATNGKLFEQVQALLGKK